MNFTREPIIETIISSKEGYKLLLRNSKGSGVEEYSVDAVEVVSFGHSFFFRSLERSKPFLVPVSDYEIVEVKEMRVALKNTNFEKAIKIGGGKDGQKGNKDQERPFEEESGEVAASSNEGRSDKKKDKRRGRRRGGRGGNSSTASLSQEEAASPPIEEEGPVFEEEKETPMIEPKEEVPVVAVPIMPKNRLIPPPTQLISDKMFKERKEQIAQAIQSESAPTTVVDNIFHSGEKESNEELVEPSKKPFPEKEDATLHFSPLQDEGLHFERSTLSSKEEEPSFSTLKGILSSSFGKFW